MYCNGTHGQSLGSLGQYEGEVSFVEDVVMENIWMLNGQYGGRIKVWAGESVGSGWVRNITYRNFWQARTDYGVYLDSCYFNIPSEECNAFPSKMSVEDVVFENFSGYTSGKNGRAVARLTCSTSEDAVCNNITFRNFTMTSPCGDEAVVICDGVDDLGYDCVPFDSDEARAALADTCVTEQVTIEPPWPVREW